MWAPRGAALPAGGRAVVHLARRVHPVHLGHSVHLGRPVRRGHPVHLGRPVRRVHRGHEVRPGRRDRRRARLACLDGVVVHPGVPWAAVVRAGRPDVEEW